MDCKTSIQKGDDLERKAYELLEELLNNEEFYVSGKNSKIYWKKAYYSEKRKGNIVFDITIETFINGASDYSLLTIIECKNLKKKVSVDDVEEFNSKISEIGEHNTKGIIITTSHFQEGALNFAFSQKIALVRLSSKDKFEWINYRIDKASKQLSNLELKKQFVLEEISENFIARINNKTVFNFADLLLESNIIDLYVQSEKYINIPYVSVERLDYIVERLSNHDIFSGKKLDTDKLCAFLSKTYPVTFNFNSTLQSNLLGKIEFNPLNILVSNNISDENRWRFTLAHEIGHLILHSSILKDKLHEKTDNDLTIDLKSLITSKTNFRIELQANLFASHLLLPFSSLKYVVAEFYALNRIHKSHLILDNQKCNRDLVYDLLRIISSEYGVSLEVAKIRLISLNLLKDEADTSIRRIIKQNYKI